MTKDPKADMRNDQRYGPNARRMRLGTKCCTECRRRKIRCIMQPGHSVCNSCVAHETECQAQQPRAKTALSKDRDGAVKAVDDMAGRLHAQLQLNQGSTYPSSLDSASSFRRPLVHSVSGDASSSSAWNGQTPSPSVGNTTSPPLSAPDPRLGGYAGAPLMDLLKDANLIQSGCQLQQQFNTSTSSQSRVQTLIRSLIVLLPDRATLQAILTETSRFWSTWPPCYYDKESKDTLQPGQHTEAIDFIYASFQSQKPAAIAKAMLFLSLCVQQLPKDSPSSMLLPSTNALKDDCVDISSTLLFVGAETGQGLDDVEARMLLYKLCLNMGKPRRAWTTVRSAAESAILQGMHRLSKHSDARLRYLWEMIWQCDRLASAILGAPAYLSNAHPSIIAGPTGDSTMEQIAFQVFKLTGEVIERDQNHAHNPNYATTVQLDEDCTAIRPTMPAEWFDLAWQAELSLGMFYNLQGIKMKYLMLVKDIHLPWMLKSTTEPRYQHSRTATLEASRDFINEYEVLRSNPHTEYINCELMDFQAFSATIILIVGLLTQPASSRNPCKEARDWALVDKVIHYLARIAERLQCSVAAQSFQSLEHLKKACRGDAGVLEKYEVVIPFFGQVRISRAEPIQSEGQSVAATAGHDSTSDQWYSNIEFSANPFGQTLPAGLGVGAELGVDWTSLMDVDMSYDWSQTFGQADFENMNMDGDGNL